MRRVWRVLVWMAGLSLFLAAFAYWQWQQLLERLHIEGLHWELHDLSVSNIRLSPLEFTHAQPGQALAVHIKDAHIQWQWHGIQPQIQVLNITDATLTVTHTNDPKTPSTDSFTLPETWNLPDVLPRNVQLKNLSVNVPCAAGRCIFTANAQGLLAENILTLALQSENTPTPVSADLIYEVQEHLPRLRVNVKAPELFETTLDTRLHEASSTQNGEQWRGDIDVHMLPPNAEWQAYFLRWLPVQENQISAINQPLQGSAHWAVAVAPLMAKSATENSLAPAEYLYKLLAQLQGSVDLAVNLPAPVPVPHMGNLSGKAHIALTGDAGRITRYAFDVDAALDSPVIPAALANFDLDIDSLHLVARSAAERTLNVNELPLQLHLETEGRVNVKLDTTLQLDGETFAFDITDGSLEMRAASWAPVENVTLNNVFVQQQFAARLQDGVMTYSQRELGHVEADIASEIANVKRLKLQLEQLAFNGDPTAWREGEILMSGAVHAAEIIHPMVLPQCWSWQGSVNANQGKAQVNGVIAANESLTIAHQLQIDPQDWQVEWQLPDIFLLATSLQDLTPLWPPLLTLARGRIGGDGNAHGDFSSAAIKGHMSWRLADITGVYDTTAFKGASGLLGVAFTTDEINITSENLTVSEVIQGLTLGPLSAQGSYRAPLASVTKGKLDIASFQASLLGGQVNIPATALDFAQPRQQLQVEFANIDLGVLLAEHPSSELSGTGKLSGSIPLSLSEKGINVTDGLLAANAPGGRLQYHSARAAEMAATSQGMKIITDALDDFHYTQLQSAVTYEDTGKLLLSVRLEGKNPAVENGRAINFNINLEEDLPAMLASLQLSNQISDVIKKRVQEKMRKKVLP